MAKVALNKSSLNRERSKLQTYEQFLPSLDLKKKQLTAELMKARRALRTKKKDLDEARAGVGERLPMLASPQFDLSGLVTLERVDIREENRMGVSLPTLHEVVCRVTPYSYLAQPHWVDVAVRELKSVIEKRLELRVAKERVARLEEAVRKITQRVNLFEKVLIPQTKANIHRIEIALGDAERAAVVRSKIAKAKHGRATAGGGA